MTRVSGWVGETEKRLRSKSVSKALRTARFTARLPAKIVVKAAITINVSAAQKSWCIIFNQRAVIQRLNRAIVSCEKTFQFAQLGG